MSLLALGNLLHHSPMPRRFMACPMLKAAGLLLQERVPTSGASLVAEDLAPEVSRPLDGEGESSMRVFTDPTTPVPEVHLLTPANLKLIEQLIARRPGMRLLTAQNGTDGINLARASLPDLILMDINLPGINGIAAMKILRLDSATAHIPIEALSANAIPRDIENGLAAGFFRYLAKPIKVDEFLETLEETMKFADKSGGNTGLTEIEVLT